MAETLLSSVIKRKIQIIILQKENQIGYLVFWCNTNKFKNIHILFFNLFSLLLRFFFCLSILHFYLGDLIRELANECGFEIDEEGSAVIDHLNFDIEDDGKVSFILKVN